MNTIKNTHSFLSSSPYAFWIGLALMLVFTCAGIGGGSWALKRIMLEHDLYKNGKVTPGLVLKKEMVESKAVQGSTKKTVFSVTYRFHIDSQTIINKARINQKLFFSLKNGDTIEIRYMPGNPEKNLPDGSRLSNLFLVFTLFGFMVGLGSFIVIIGMTIDKIRKQ